MTIGCMRCGASEDGEIITAPIAFGFKHNPGCGHGIGPLCVIKGKTPKKVETKKKEKTKKLKKGEVPWESNDSADSADTISTTVSNETETLSTTDNS